jgi:hypothetical protein
MVSKLDTKSLPTELAGFAELIVIALQNEAGKYVAKSAVPRIELAKVEFTRVIDPGNQQPGYQGVWRNARNDRCGEITFNSDHSFYAEYDLFCPHPRDERWFVEMVTAWGREGTLRSEAKLIPSIEG